MPLLITVPVLLLSFFWQICRSPSSPSQMLAERANSKISSAQGLRSLRCSSLGSPALVLFAVQSVSLHLRHLQEQL